MLEGLTPKVTRFPCQVKSVAESLEDADKKILFDAVNDSTRWSANGLSSALNSRGLVLSRYAIEKHRSGRCGEC
jgi:hypothetical protein